MAWVEVLQPQSSLRQVRFYRQTRQGWLHTAPHARFWQDPVELAFGRVLVRADRRDLPAIEPQVAHIVDVVDDVCATLDCPADVGLEVHFAQHDVPPGLSGTVLTLSSPWLTGISVDGSWDEGYARSLTYWVVYGLVSQIVRSDYGERWRPSPAYPPDPTREELLHVCATLHSHSGRYSADARPEMLGVMWGACSLQGFAEQ